MPADEVDEQGAGATIVLRSGAATATIFPDHGGRLGQLDLGDGPLLRRPAGDLGWAHWGCYPLLPWSNRIPGGRLAFGDLEAVLPVNWEDGSAIHGLAASRPWTVREHDDRSASLEVDVSGGPYAVHGFQMFQLHQDGLRLRLGARNDGDLPVPMGLGIHPWFRYGRVRVPADERWPGEPLPTGSPVSVDGPYDLRAGVEPALMDACFTALTDPAAEVPGAVLRWDGPITNVVVYTGVAGWVCVEPVTMASDGFALAGQQRPHHGVQVVPAGGTLEVSYRFERAEGATW